MIDALSDIMQHVRLRSCVYFQRDFFGPWGMEIKDTGFAQFHVVTHGNCVVIVDGQAHDCTRGDVLFFPRGHEHILADKPNSKHLPGPQVMTSFLGEAPYFCDGSSPTRIICGHYEYRNDIQHPLLADLPEFIHVRTKTGLGDIPSISVLPLILEEYSKSRPGQTLIIERYAEILLIHTLRMHHQETKQPTGFYAGLADERLGRAISRIHKDYSSPIGLAELAQSAAMSRSAFALKFKTKMRISPIEYLIKWRMLVAEGILKTTELPIAQIARRVGYESDISFARAFKREYGMAPSSMRGLV